MVGARVRRQQVAYAEGRGLSSRRACALLSVARSTLGYVSRWSPAMRRRVPAMRTLAGAVSAVRLSHDPDLPGAAGPRAGRRADVSPVAPGGPPGAEEAATPPRGDQSPAAAAADGDQSRLGVRLRVRHLRGRPHAEVPDGDRRVHAGVPGDRCRRRHSVRPRDRGADAARERPRRAALPALRQRSGVRGAAILRWLQTAQIETAFIDPGKPWQNGADESFNGKFRDQHLSLQWFRNRLEAKVSIERGGVTTTRCGRTRALAT